MEIFRISYKGSSAFLSDFDAYCKLSMINNTDGREVDAF